MNIITSKVQCRRNLHLKNKTNNNNNKLQKKKKGLQTVRTKMYGGFYINLKVIL